MAIPALLASNAPTEPTPMPARVVLAHCVPLAPRMLITIRRQTAPTATPAITVPPRALARACPALLERQTWMAILRLVARRAPLEDMCRKPRPALARNMCAPMARLILTRIHPRSALHVQQAAPRQAAVLAPALLAPLAMRMWTLTRRRLVRSALLARTRPAM